MINGVAAGVVVGDGDLYGVAYPVEACVINVIITAPLEGMVYHKVPGLNVKGYRYPVLPPAAVGIGYVSLIAAVKEILRGGGYVCPRR